MSEPVYGSRGLPALLLAELVLWWIAFGGQNMLLFLLGVLHGAILVWLFAITAARLRHLASLVTRPTAEDYLTPVETDSGDGGADEH